MPHDVYPKTPEAQKEWLEDSIASRLAYLKEKLEGRNSSKANVKKGKHEAGR